MIESKGYPCPVCGFYTIGEDMFGSYNICPICNWEDDGFQLANPACGGGANKESVIDAKKSIINRIPTHMRDYKGYKRDPNWRPLSETEIEIYKKETLLKYWKNKAIMELSEVYWLRNKT
jgi:Cysteine-rich CPCC